MISNKAISDMQNGGVEIEVLLDFKPIDFIRFATEAISGKVPDPHTEEILLLRIAGGCPKYRILYDIALMHGASDHSGAIKELPKFIEAMADSTYPAIHNVTDLFSHFDEAFVDVVYKAVLKRPVDPSGNISYTGILRRGYSRTYVLQHIATSDEARSVGRSIPGLDEHLEQYRKFNSKIRSHFARPEILPESDRLFTRLQRASTVAIRNQRAQEAEIRALQLHTATIVGSSASKAANVDAAARRTFQESLAAIESALLKRHDALIEIERDSFERELGAMRKLLMQNLEREQTPRRHVRKGQRIRSINKNTVKRR